jgi:hypothetical protein
MLGTPDARRGLRAIVMAIVVLALVALVYWITGMLAAEPRGLLSIARWCLMIVAIAALGYSIENGVRAIRIKGPAGTEASFSADEPVSDPK